MDKLTQARSFALAAVHFGSQQIRLQVLTGDRLTGALKELGLSGQAAADAAAALVAQHQLTVGATTLLLREIAPGDLVPLERLTFADALDAAGLNRSDVKVATGRPTKTVTEWRLRRLQPSAYEACRVAAKLRLSVEAIDWRTDFAAKADKAAKEAATRQARASRA
ncbi:hypothetical protein E7T09_01030 [Deinococcus sp. KSM4-11]|uniref:hypothetical protein n=1 Tax=Deinococcus sp. KSM4-11 TaxID=2568654 RepID=UPI0010A38F36|nr:hypothetical protein [Deinococcus sp. KSM4-11]THF87852.1 hypothetical protein E7T09_01030 [Deinococcus sp. KSM4-11]